MLTIKTKPWAMVAILFTVFGTNWGATLEQNIGYCAAPKIADNFDIEWAHDHFNEGWYLSVGNKQARKHIYEILQGKNMTENSVADYSEMCPKFTIDIESTMDITFRGQYLGFGDKSADWNCSFEDDNFQCKYQNSQDPTYVQTGQAYLSYFDGKEDHNVFVAVLCFDNGDSGYFVASLTKSITKEEREAVNTHLKSIGFDPNLKMDWYTDSCP